MTALEALRIVDGLDLGADGPDREHLLIEAVKLALADRREYLGDPGRDDDRARTALARRLDRRRGAREHRSRSARASRRATREPDGGTIYMCAADRDGMLVSLIQSNFTGAGSGLRVEEWGLNLHNRGSAFVLDDAHPNGIGPGKMPLHTLIPAMALRDGRPWLVFGTEGGHGQAQTHTQLHRPHARRRRRPAAGDQRAAFHDRSRERSGRDRGPLRPGVDRRPARPRSRDRRRAGLPPRSRASRTRSSCMRPGYRCGSDPRAEGGTAGSVARTLAPMGPARSPGSDDSRIVISVGPLAAASRSSSGCSWKPDPARRGAAALLAVLGATDWVDG